ncbi:MAG: hypothetical protein Q8904_11195 [Bacteroidota bacterium]|nr:hypothetical protein [Bacteroidota bacterium]
MMNELLEKYFRAETSLTEEQELKHYFSTGNVSPAHEMYRALFDAFEQEKQDIAIEPLKKVIRSKRKEGIGWIKILSYSGIAAAIVLAFWIQRPQQPENYAVIHGTRIDNPEYAQRYAERKMNSVNEMLKEGLRPMQAMEAVKQSLQPLKKIKETHGNIIETEKDSQH